MSKEQVKREEIEDKYKWDLTTIYKSDEAFLEDYDKVSKELKNIAKYKGSITKDANSLLTFLKYSDDLERKLYKLYFYAHLSNDQDTTNTKYQDYYGKASNLFAEYEELTAYINPELMSVDYDKILEFIKTNKELGDYSQTLDNIYRFKEHILDEKSENIIASYTKITNSPEEIYSAFTDSDIKFGTIKDETEEDIELTESNYSLYIRSKKQRVRKESFEKLLGAYGSYKNTLAKTFSYNIERLTTIAKLRNYQSSIEASLYSDNISTEVYDNLVTVVNDNLGVLYKYYDLKKECLGLKELHLYDIYVDLIDGFDKDYSIEEAKKLVIDSLSILGEDYIKIINKAFDENWIDIKTNEGKRTGAYSSGFYDINPFILLNYEGKLDDVSTLAHELGHSAHTYYSCKNQQYQNSQYKIFVAEVASTVNELLLNHHILNNSTSNEEKLNVLNNLMELYKGTIYRQTMFAEFERNCHKKHENKEILTHETLGNDYYNLVKKYFGKDVVSDDLIKYEWTRIPHFYYNFYVYKYAIGLSCASHFVTNILEGKEKALENYKNFLSSGGKDYPINILKEAGIDITKKDFVLSAINMFDNTIDEFQKIKTKTDKNTSKN